ncbi:type VII secretion-associated serine protease mycosin [Actinophytocola oryzae]|uniref:Type VII secretion-associated serine protease mycosin n=1 Tax=Actinophytocola oryzae TaxID=502181 RepID=A0A4V3FR47_9PSEU|nr:type VII secretion-associated serine protease mycosin [Actinophytocola oryzae]TDV42161.1 type VII secretion-associated serine protease mycosin [Actinophytocola oryzae]
MRRLAGLLVACALVVVPAAPAYAQPSSSQEEEPCLPPPQSVDPSVPWAQRQLAPDKVWPLTDGAGVTVGVVDTGVDGHVPQLQGVVLPGVDTTRPGHEPADSDCFGHGTFVAGIIAAVPAEGTGYAGVAPGARILPIRCATTDTPNAPGSLTPEGMALGIRVAVDEGARVINVSASTTEPNPALADAVRYAEERDVVLVASAANSANEGDPVTYPAAFPSVIAVGAVDEAGQHADFSQTGPFVSLVAPGVEVLGLGPGGPGHWKGNGTSYSAPFVAGVAALVRAYRPGLSAAQVKHRLLATATHPALTLPDPALGWGMVNPLAAVTTVLPEEAGAKPDMVMPPGANAAPVVPEDEMGPVLASAGMIGAVCLVLATLLLVRMFGAGRKRGFRPARVVEVTTPEA